ncbi:MAG: NAD-dependent succinate-semialdehyde dehydrogenase [Marinoscillum sp.]
MADFNTINPATEEIISEFNLMSNDEINNKIDKTYDTWSQWKQSSFERRAESMNVLAQLLIKEKEDLGKVITTEMGKPITQSISEIEKCAWVCEYYAENAEHFLANDFIDSDASESYVHHSPLGIVLAIMPWNFPFWQVFRFAAPGLMAGNAALLKHSRNTTQCGLEIEKLFMKAGFPDHLFTALIVDSKPIEFIISNPKIAAVTLTGSTGAGKSVASIAGKYLKKTVLELGGSDPYVILNDADLDLAAQMCVTGRLINTGQSCIAAKRFIVTEKNVVEFTEKVKSLLSSKNYGNPLDSDVELGSMARKDLREELHEQVSKSIKLGAKCLIGGEIPQGTGYFYPATLLTDVTKGMPAFDDELFGPVACIITAKDEEEAIRIANDSDFGLGSSLFSTNHGRAKAIAETQIDAGCTFINSFVKSDPRLPFGGVKQSGFGRELSFLGIKEFVNAKTIYLA